MKISGAMTSGVRWSDIVAVRLPNAVFIVITF